MREDLAPNLYAEYVRRWPYPKESLMHFLPGIFYIAGSSCFIIGTVLTWLTH